MCDHSTGGVDYQKTEGRKGREGEEKEKERERERRGGRRRGRGGEEKGGVYYQQGFTMWAIQTAPIPLRDMM